jgi:hypothetical protein
MYLFSLVIRIEELVYLRPIPGSGSRKRQARLIWKEADMVQCRIRVIKWLNTTPALGICTLCSRELKVPMNALKKSSDAQASLQEQFDRHKCESLDSSEVDATANVVLRQEPDEEDDEEEDDRRQEEDDDDEGDGDGYSE